LPVAREDDGGNGHLRVEILDAGRQRPEVLPVRTRQPRVTPAAVRVQDADTGARPGRAAHLLHGEAMRPGRLDAAEERRVGDLHDVSDDEGFRGRANRRQPNEHALAR